MELTGESGATRPEDGRERSGESRRPGEDPSTESGRPRWSLPDRVHPDAPAGRRWLHLRDEGPEEELLRFDQILRGNLPPGSDVPSGPPPSDVPPDSKAWRAWWILQEHGDEAGLVALAKRIERAESADEIRGLKFCDCGCARLSISEAVDNPDPLLMRRYRLADGTWVTELPLANILREDS